MSAYRFNPFTGTLDIVKSSSTWQIGYGSTDVDFPNSYYLQDTDGNFIYDSHGYKIFTGITGWKTPYILDSDGEILIDSDDSPIVEPNWRFLVVDGIATQLTTLETNVEYVTIQAKWTNLGKIWIAQDRTHAIYLKAGGTYTRLVNDLRDIYIIGNGGEGVNYEYGTTDDVFLTTPGGDFVTTPGGDQIG